MDNLTLDKLQYLLEGLTGKKIGKSVQYQRMISSPTIEQTQSNGMKR